MPSPEEQAYSAVERAYGQGDFARALELALALHDDGTRSVTVTSHSALGARLLQP